MSLTLDDVRGRAAISVRELATLLGISESHAWESVHRGDVPSRRLGRRVLIPVPELLRFLGEDA
jgi:excisionase family DNA binding protein